MEPLESPRVAVVGGVLSRGEDTDGERTDDEVDFPSEPSYVSQHQEEGKQDTATILLEAAKRAWGFIQISNVRSSTYVL